MLSFLLFQDTKVNGSKVNASIESTSKTDTEPKEQKKTLNAAKEVEAPQATAGEEICPDETDDPSTPVILDDSVEETVDEILKSMPKDFFDFWQFCKSVNKSKPEGIFVIFLHLYLSVTL